MREIIAKIIKDTASFHFGAASDTVDAFTKDIKEQLDSALASQSDEGMLLTDEEIVKIVNSKGENFRNYVPRGREIAKAQLLKATPLIEARVRKETAKEIIEFIDEHKEWGEVYYKIGYKDFEALKVKYLNQEGK